MDLNHWQACFQEGLESREELVRRIAPWYDL